MKLFIFIAVLIHVLVQCAADRFDNYTLYRLVPKDENALNLLTDLQNEIYHQYDFWTYPRGVDVPVDILVPPKRKVDINNIIVNNKFDFEIVMENVQDKIDEAEGKNKLARSTALGFNFESYHRVDEINNWLSSLTQEYPGVVTLVEAGRSYEGRTIVGVKVSFRPGNEERGIWLDSLIHAREWIAGATSTYILNEILTSTDPFVRQTVERFDWYIFPVLNPDGYEFSHTSDRLWRKTRKPYATICYGADPNRNWGYLWNTGGASNFPCSDTYPGPNEFSEVETESVSRYITSISNNLKIYISFHSYSQMLLLPYGHTKDHLDNYDEVIQIGRAAVETLALRYGTQYTVGNIAETIYLATGSSMDWVKGVFGTKIAFTYELRDLGGEGFLLSPEQIIPTGQETFDSIMTILEKSGL